jgi:hypothetical protein
MPNKESLFQWSPGAAVPLYPPLRDMHAWKVLYESGSQLMDIEIVQIADYSSLNAFATPG